MSDVWYFDWMNASNWFGAKDGDVVFRAGYTGPEGREPDFKPDFTFDVAFVERLLIGRASVVDTPVQIDKLIGNDVLPAFAEFFP